MGRYIARRLVLIFLTLIGIITLNFFIVQLAPSGPVDQMIATLTGQDSSSTNRVAGAASGPLVVDMASSVKSQYAGAQGLDPELIKVLISLKPPRGAHRAVWTYSLYRHPLIGSSHDLVNFYPQAGLLSELLCLILCRS